MKDISLEIGKNYAVDSEYEAKEGEVIIYTNGKRQDGGHVFH